MQPVWRTTLRMIDERQIHTCMFCMISSSTLIFIKMMLFLYPNNKYAFMWYFKEWICAEKYTLKDMMCKYVIRPNNQIIRLNKQPVVRKKKPIQPFNITILKHDSFYKCCSFFCSSEQSSWCLWSGIVSAFISPCLISYIWFLLYSFVFFAAFCSFLF